MSKCREQTTMGRPCKNAATRDGLCTQHNRMRKSAERGMKHNLRAVHHLELLALLARMLNPDEVVSHAEIVRHVERGRELLP